ncbi:MAG: Rieske (2Fe-2S) protein [Phycisphaeraceae bacterium]|nr:Rieske (2Fe-2S) protein [Phycisphaeraceae bacterium]
MSEWIEVTECDHLKAGERKCIAVEDKQLAFFNVEGDIHAISNVCPHAGLPLGDGDLAGTVLTCPFHGYAYDIASGRNVDFPDDVPVRRYPVQIEDGTISVKLEPEDASPDPGSA